MVDQYRGELLIEEHSRAKRWRLEQPEKLRNNKEREIFTVSQVNRMARELLEGIRVWVEGELSDVNTGYRYYTYFTMRDDRAALPVIMEKALFQELDFPLEEGTKVVAFGTLGLYEKRGNYQLRAIRLELYGEGEMRRRIERLKRKLAAEGLFADERKKLLPIFPERIGVISAVEGAAVEDVIRTVVRRYLPAYILVRDVRVQGKGASLEICEAIEVFNREFPVDVIIVARGGGSLQDLEPFNSEDVARSIAGSSIPIITGVGHEPDVTVADLVADFRASTPTGAGEAAVPESTELLFRLEAMAAGSRRRVIETLKAKERHLGYLATRPVFSRSEFMLAEKMQRLDRATETLRRALARGFQRMMERFKMVLSKRTFARSDLLVVGEREELVRKAERMLSQARRVLQGYQSRLGNLEGRLEALSPLAVLERGYAIVFPRGKKRALRSPREAAIGDKIDVRLYRGHLYCEVEEKSDVEEKE